MSYEAVTSALRQRRAYLIRQIFTSEVGQELIRVDAALNAMLLGNEHTDWHGWDLCKSPGTREWPPPGVQTTHLEPSVEVEENQG